MAEIAKSGRTLAKHDLTDKKPPRPAKSPAERGGRAMPQWQEMQLATLVSEPPDGDEWLSEMKYDGYRALIAIAGGKSKIYTRKGLDWTHKFPGIAAAAAALSTDGTLIDGEIVAFDRNGKTDFSTLQQAIKGGGRDLSCFCFDLLELNGEDLRKLPLIERKGRLEKLVGEGAAPLIFSTHIAGSADQVLAQICSAGHEGIVAKRAGDRYRSGRGRSWLKVKCDRGQELVVGGYQLSDKAGRKVRSLLVGAYENGKLIYRGRVGAFEGDSLSEIEAAVGEYEQKTSPFVAVPRDARKGVRYLTPELVIEARIAEFTADGNVRHGVMKGIRLDKNAKDVVLETSEPTLGGETMAVHEERESFAGVKLSSHDKVLFKDCGVTKADLAAHYERVAERMLPHVGKRLLSLVRCPEGIDGECFFQKHESRGFPKQIKKMEVAESDGDRDNYLYVEDLSGLIAGVQMGTLEFHIWGSRVDKNEQPDRIVFDLDPDEGLDFGDVRDAAFDVRDRLAKLGLQTVPMVTGGKGVHVIAPLQRRAEWPEVKAFARGFAVTISEDAPDRYVANMSKAKRKGRIFVDYLRNERGATAISPYSSRARKGAPVATPVSWDELKSLPGANVFHLADMEKRLALPDPWAGSEKWKQSVTKKMIAAVSEG